MKIGIVDVGGGFRDIYSAGVLDYVYGTLSNSDGEYPLDYQAVLGNPMEIIIVATNAQTGKAKYFDKSNIKKDAYHILKASSAIPFVCQPYWIEGNPYYDGALGDPIPIERAFENGCDKVVLLLSLPVDTIRESQRDESMAKRIKRKYPHAAKMLALRAKHYNETVELARKYEKQGKLLIVSPNDTCGVSTLSRNAENLDRLYKKGYHDGEKIGRFLI